MKLINKSALVAEIERRKQDAINNCGGFKSMREHECDSCIVGQYEEMKNIIDTLEVKEVDLNFQRFAKEMDAVFALPSSETKNTEEEPLNWEYAIAKHFYSLGLAQKGEEV